jgi:hypothetical protein
VPREDIEEEEERGFDDKLLGVYDSIFGAGKMYGASDLF